MGIRLVPGQLSLAIHSRVGAISTDVSWIGNRRSVWRHTRHASRTQWFVHLRRLSGLRQETSRSLGDMARCIPYLHPANFGANNTASALETAARLQYVSALIYGGYEFTTRPLERPFDWLSEVIKIKVTCPAN